MTARQATRAVLTRDSANPALTMHTDLDHVETVTDRWGRGFALDARQAVRSDWDRHEAEASLRRAAEMEAAWTTHRGVAL